MEIEVLPVSTDDDLVDEMVEEALADLKLGRDGWSPGLLRYGVRAGLRAGVNREEVRELIEAAKEALPYMLTECYQCLQCGQPVVVDEHGCCVGCGGDAYEVTVDAKARLLAAVETLMENETLASTEGEEE